MARQNEGENSTAEESTKREERAQRILDAAAELVQRWGYKKTTIDDIARLAGVAKGTIYLHWKTREDLFVALLLREKVREGQIITEQMANDPEGATLHGMMKYALLSALRSPLLRAVMLRDTDILGDLLHTQISQQHTEQVIGMFNTFLEFLRANGLIRTDYSLDEQLNAVEAIALGFLTVDQLLPPERQIPDEDKARLAADMVRSTFALRPPIADEQQKTVKSFSDMVDTMQAYREKEFEQ